MQPPAPQPDWSASWPSGPPAPCSRDRPLKDPRGSLVCRVRLPAHIHVAEIATRTVIPLPEPRKRRAEIFTQRLALVELLIIGGKLVRIALIGHTGSLVPNAEILQPVLDL